MSLQRLRRDDAGTAVVEFVFLAVLMMLPLVYVVLAAGAVQRAAFGLTAAARDAGRAYVTAGSDQAGRARAYEVARIAVADQDSRLRLTPDDVTVECGGVCGYQPGDSVSVRLGVRVPLPGIPAILCGRHACAASIPVSAVHTERIDCFAPADSAPPGRSTGTPC